MAVGLSPVSFPLVRLRLVGLWPESVVAHDLVRRFHSLSGYIEERPYACGAQYDPAAIFVSFHAVIDSRRG